MTPQYVIYPDSTIGSKGNASDGKVKYKKRLFIAVRQFYFQEHLSKQSGRDDILPSVLSVILGHLSVTCKSFLSSPLS